MVRISVFTYLLFSTFSVIVFFLPLYLSDKGLDSGQIGTIFALGSLISVIAQPYWGFVSDRRKTVKHVLLAIMIASFFTSIGLFSVNSFVLIAVFYIGFSFFSSGTAPLVETLCVSYAQDHNKDYGRIRVWGEIGVGTSAFMLGLLVEQIGLGYIWLIYLALTGVAIAAGYLFVSDSQAAAAPVDLKALGKLFRQPKLLWFLLLILIVSTPHRMNDSMLALYLEQLGASESQLGLAWLAATLSSVPVMIFVGKLIRKWNELGIFTVAALFYSVRWAVYSFAESPTLLIVSQLLHSLSFPLFFVASIVYIASIVPSELKATGQAAFAVTFLGMGGIIGSAGGGYLMREVGPQVTYGLGSALAFIGALAAIATYISSRRKMNRILSGGVGTNG